MRQQPLYALLRYSNGWPRRLVVTDPTDALLEAIERLCRQHGARLVGTTTFLSKPEEDKS